MPIDQISRAEKKKFDAFVTNRIIDWTKALDFSAKDHRFSVLWENNDNSREDFAEKLLTYLEKNDFLSLFNPALYRKYVEWQQRQMIDIYLQIILSTIVKIAVKRNKQIQSAADLEKIIADEIFHHKLKKEIRLFMPTMTVALMYHAKKTDSTEFFINLGILFISSFEMIEEIDDLSRHTSAGEIAIHTAHTIIGTLLNVLADTLQIAAGVLGFFVLFYLAGEYIYYKMKGEPHPGLHKEVRFSLAAFTCVLGLVGLIATGPVGTAVALLLTATAFLTNSYLLIKEIYAHKKVPHAMNVKENEIELLSADIIILKNQIHMERKILKTKLRDLKSIKITDHEVHQQLKREIEEQHNKVENLLINHEKKITDLKKLHHQFAYLKIQEKELLSLTDKSVGLLCATLVVAGVFTSFFFPPAGFGILGISTFIGLSYCIGRALHAGYQYYQHKQQNKTNHKMITNIAIKLHSSHKMIQEICKNLIKDIKDGKNGSELTVHRNTIIKHFNTLQSSGLSLLGFFASAERTVEKILTGKSKHVQLEEKHKNTFKDHANIVLTILGSETALPNVLSNVDKAVDKVAEGEIKLSDKQLDALTKKEKCLSTGGLTTIFARLDKKASAAKALDTAAQSFIPSGDPLGLN